MKRSFIRSALLSLSLVAALALASGAQDEGDAAKEGAEGVPPEAGAVADFSGKYIADGVSNGGRAYKAMVEIAREGDVYQVIWVMGPREGYMGVGVAEGDALCVGWSIGEVPGVVIYKPDAAGQSKKLVGRWAAPGSRGKTYTETLTPVP